MTTQDTLKVGLMFLNAFAGLIAAYPGPEVDGLVRVVCAALVAGCGAALLYLNPPGKKTTTTAAFTPKQVGQLADELERRAKDQG